MSAPHNFGELIPRDAPADRIWQVEVAGDDSHREITLGAFHPAADAVARGLVAQGLTRGERVGILAANSAEYLIAFFGIVRAGLVAVPINYKLPAATVAEILDDADVRFVFADAERAGQAAGWPVVRLDDEASWSAFADPGSFDSPEMGDDETALILYTSGSSGRPKGVPLTHGGYVWAAHVLSGSMPPMEGKRMLVAAPLYHMNGLLQSTLMSMSGGTVVLMRRFDPRGYLEAAARHRCDIVTAVPTMLALAVREKEALATLDLSPVKLVIMGSAPVSEALFAEAGRVFPAAMISNTWGTTEGSPVVFGPHPEGKPKPRLAVGYPLPEAEIRLVGGNSEDEGVIWVRSRAVMPGYLNLPEESARRLHDGWYDTGDIMRRDADGFYYFVGRADDMFVCGGENVYPTEVERLLESHPGIAQASVVPLEDEIKGMVPVAYVVPASGAGLTEDEVKAFALKEGPAYRHPRHVAFVDALPLAGTNKVDRQSLTIRAAEEFGAAQRARRAST
ncbi:class I adenylate-forming enzyme family protein [Microbaculum marinum]|uniref:Class I adenylate-forming enzyme family protein n=1 Tax=Microbaculum marinum TaxID=1764581 RepID=A0AAW9RNS1_9HYPH